MSPFKLQELEGQFAEAFWLDGEDLQLAGAVKLLTEVERHLWTSKVQTEHSEQEVEIQITPSKVKSFSCECSYFREEGNCPHIVATLIELRALINHRKRERDIQKAAAEERSAENRNKLTLDAVMEEVSREELISFIKDYARHHRDFSLAIKARFTPQVDHIQSREKYAQLLQTAISVARKADRRISIRGVQKLAKVLEEILFQAEGYFYAGHYPEVIATAGILLEKITPILNKVDSGREKLDAFLRKAFSLLGKVATAEAPPALKQKLWDYAVQESSKLFYRNQSMDVAFFQLLYRLAIDETQKQALREQLDNHLDRNITRPKSEEELLLVKLRLLEQQGDPDLINRFFQDHTKKQGLLKKAVKRARLQGDWQSARYWIKMAIEQGPVKESLQEWKKLALTIAQDSGNKQDILPLAIDLFVDSGKANYLDLALAQGEDSAKISNEALQRLVLQAPRPMRQEAIATVLSRSNRLEELLQFLEQSNSLLLLQKFDFHWHKKDREKVFPLYHKLLMEYLKNHLGRITSQKIKSIIDFLNKTGRSAMAQRLVTEMKTTYPERHSLMEELDII